MKIELKEITVGELSDGYLDNCEGGVIGYGGKLDIRPPYQREFIYKDKQRDAVINTVQNGFPLNVMYWAVRDDGTFEVIDGQQRTISLCQYVHNDFSIDGLMFNNLTGDKRNEILDYKLMIYLCSGTDSERLDWFKTINIAGERLTNQELLNAIYAGSWVADAKRYFSKTECAAYGIVGKYMSGTAIRQDYLETAIDWISEGNIKMYMSEYQHKSNANELWLYFQSVINWVKVLFPNYRREMKGLEWGRLYNTLKDEQFDSAELERDVAELMMDDDVSSKSGIYKYLLTGQEKWLNIRDFTLKQKRESYERQKGKCPICKKKFEITEMEGDHITPWCEGGKTDAANCQMLCRGCNRRKSSK